jgi:hypothetical protein
MDHIYPAVPLSWALKVTKLAPAEVAYGIQNGFLHADAEHPALAKDAPLPVAMNESELAAARDVLFRLLMVNLHKQWFSCNRPCEALEFLARDFEDCPSSSIGDGMLLACIAGISETAEYPELDPEYFAQKVRTFGFLTNYVMEIVRAGVRTMPEWRRARVG